VARSRPSVSALDKRICDLESYDALLRGQIGNLQSERQRLKEATDKHRHHLEKLKKENEALEVKKKELQCQMEEACSEATTKEEKSRKAEDQGYKQGRKECVEFFRELLVTLVLDAFRVEGYFEVYIQYVGDHHLAHTKG